MGDGDGRIRVDDENAVRHLPSPLSVWAAGINLQRST
jgi:hypothetical protein